MIQAARGRMPLAATAASAGVVGKGWRGKSPPPPGGVEFDQRGGRGRFFPDAAKSFEVWTCHQWVAADPGKIRLRKLVTKTSGDWPKAISGLLVEKSGTNRLA